jgi:hypothetical protein
MHWAREKSTDHADCIGRHLIERGTVDTDGVRHSTKVAWRAFALLQLEIEAGPVKRTRRERRANTDGIPAIGRRKGYDRRQGEKI